LNSIADIVKKPIVRISSLNGVSVLVRILGGLIASKAIAEFIGAGGLAVVGNLRNFMTYIDTFSTLGMQNGVIKYTAENEKDEEKLYTMLGTVFISILAVILVLSAILIVFADSLSRLVFTQDNQYAWVFKVLAFSLPWYAGSLLFMYVLNGLGKYRQVIWLNISGNIAGVALSALLMWKFQINGALFGIILYQAVFFMISFYSVWKRFDRFAFLKLKYFDFSILRNLFSYSLMTVVGSMLFPVVFISIRNNLISNYSPDTAGHWEAMNRLSTFYMMFASTMLTVYFLPKLSTSQTIKETKAVFLSYYKSILPLFAIGLIAIYLLRHIIIRLIFTEDFMPMADLFAWQLTGDFLKVGSLILGYEFFAKKLTKAFLVTEFISFTILYISSTYFMEVYGVQGAVMAHAFTYFVYWIVLLVYFRKKIV
jgi:O-antigen/teichoic acid export membrane protein